MQENADLRRQLDDTEEQLETLELKRDVLQGQAPYVISQRSVRQNFSHDDAPPPSPRIDASMCRGDRDTIHQRRTSQFEEKGLDSSNFEMIGNSTTLTLTFWGSGCCLIFLTAHRILISPLNTSANDPLPRRSLAISRSSRLSLTTDQTEDIELF